VGPRESTTIWLSAIETWNVAERYEWHRSVILQSIGEFVISAMESIMNDVDLEDRDADVEIYLSALDESEHREMQAVIRDAGAVDRLLDDPRTYHS